MTQITDLPNEVLSKIIYLFKGPAINFLLIHNSSQIPGGDKDLQTYCKWIGETGVISIPSSQREARNVYQSGIRSTDIDFTIFEIMNVCKLWRGVGAQVVLNRKDHIRTTTKDNVKAGNCAFTDNSDSYSPTENDC